MGCVSTPYRRLPHQPKLFLRLLDDFSSVASFYAYPPTLEAITQIAKSLDFPADRRKAVVEVLRDINATLGAGDATRRNLERLENGAVAVVSGQQVGLFGGPAYAFLQGAQRHPHRRGTDRSGRAGRAGVLDGDRRPRPGRNSPHHFLQGGEADALRAAGGGSAGSSGWSREAWSSS